MLAKYSLAAGLAYVSTGVARDTLTSWCGSDAPLSDYEKAHQLGMKESISAQPKFRLASAGNIDVNVYLNVVGNTMEEGQLEMNDTIIEKQMERMNLDHENSKTGFKFHLKSVNRYADPEWAGHGAYEPGTFPPGTRKGGKGDLNLYYMTHLEEAGLNGISAFPWSSNRTYFEDDYILISTTTAPGGSSAPLNNGDVTVHEVGHWLGLWHTFQNGCEGGDYVDDTPAQKEPSNGCPIGKDSCDYPGLDPIHNYMDYSSCQTEFTPGQVERMQFMWEKFRA